jgi:MFS family permease
VERSNAQVCTETRLTHARDALDTPSLRLKIAALAVSILGQLSLLFSAFLLPLAMQQAKVNDAVASEILSMEFGAYFLAALGSSFVRRFNPRKVALLASLLLSVGSFLAAMSGEPIVFSVARIICGVAGGLVMVSASRAIASHEDYEKIVAFVLIGTSIFGIGALVVVPAIFQAYGSSPTYAVFSILGLITAFLCPLLQVGTRTVSRTSLNFGNAAFILLSAYFFSRLSDAALWPYNERFGARVGFEAGAIGIIFAMSAIISVVGPFIALRAKTGAAIVMLFTGALLAKAFAPFLMTALPVPATFVGAQMIVTVMYVTVQQIFISRFAAIDATGRLAALAVTAGLAADATGLWVSGESFARGSFGGVAIASASLGVVAAILALVALAFAARPNTDTH